MFEISISPEHPTLVKFCGLMRAEDIEIVNELRPDFAGFILSEGFRRSIKPSELKSLRGKLDMGIRTVGVFVDEPSSYVADLLNQGIVDIAQLHGHESEDYILKLRKLTLGHHALIKAFKVQTQEDIERAESSPADYVLLDSGTGTGRSFDWGLILGIRRPFFLAGGLDHTNVGEAIVRYSPYAVDVSSGIETDGMKDAGKAAAFMRAVSEAASEIDAGI